MFKAKGKLYRIGYLHVGKIIGNTEHPVLFHEDQDHHYVNLYIEDGEIRDVEGNIIKIEDNYVMVFVKTIDKITTDQTEAEQPKPESTEEVQHSIRGSLKRRYDMWSRRGSGTA